MDLREIPGFPDYMVTMDGRVWSRKRLYICGGWLKPQVNTHGGHLRVTLHAEQKSYPYLIHRLVLETFVGPCPQGMECRHLDGNPTNNRLNNLCWGTHKENMQDTARHCILRGENNGCAKLIEEQVRVIFHTYHDGVYTRQELADHFNVSHGCIEHITKKESWSYLWDD